MPDVAVRISNLGKAYQIQEQSREKQRYKTLREEMLEWPRRLLSSGSVKSREFWAVKNLSLEIHQGEVVGIIGRNGAGKSTLLKLLSNITQPTRGRIELYGRVGSLLEVGTGFHPELTGRENIFLNGAILGMSKAEIRRNFDDIVAFAEVEKFLDMPVKRYSSGMYVRLAFAVAAYLETEILIVDEVLAVGDAAFQRKCLDKMEAVGQNGRTVLFVSHNMPAITRLCQRAVLLNHGELLQDGSPHQIVSSYLRSGIGTTASREWPGESPGDEVVKLRAVRLRTREGKVTDVFDIRRPIGIEIEFEVLRGAVLTPNFVLLNEDGVCLFHPHDWNGEQRNSPRRPGLQKRICWLPANFMAEGTFTINMAISSYEPVIVHCHEVDVVAFQVVDSHDGDSARGNYGGSIPGVIRPILPWSNEEIAAEVPLVIGK